VQEHVDRERLVALTSSLVAAATANPPGNESAVAPVLREALAPWSPTWTEVEPLPGRLSLIARLPSPSSAGAPAKLPTLIVNGHTDVVPVVAERWSRGPFEPAVVDGRLYGRGSADMKGGVAAAICALAALDAAGWERRCEIVFQFVADEERGGALGTRVLMESGLIIGDACLVPEPTGLSVSVAERGRLEGEVVLRGQPGHGSRPREGVSAIEHAARVVLALHAADFGDEPHLLLGQPSANVGTIQGGSAPNVIAEEARIGFDRRLLPGTSLDEAVAALHDRIDAAGVDGIDYQVTVGDFGEGSEMAADHPFAELVKRCVRDATGATPATIGMTFTTDARFVRNQAGLPAVVCGPGELAQAHGIDEWVDVGQLVAATAAFAELYRAFGPGWDETPRT